MWHDALSRRQFFEKYAKERGFDALIADNWYSQSKSEILSVPVSYSILYYLFINNKVKFIII